MEREEARTADLTDDETYKKFVNYVLQFCTVNDISNALHVSLPTVCRWSRGVSAPHEMMREPIRRFAISKGFL